MDDSQEGLLLIATSMAVLLAFALAVLAVMIIYRKRKMQHLREIQEMNNKFSRELLVAQLETQQQTMQYIGSEIHDNVGQQLTLAFLYTQQIHLPDSQASERLSSIASIINDSLTDLRSLSKNLIEPSTLKEDLDQLIQKECIQLRNSGFCEIEFSLVKVTDDDLSFAVKSFMFRILQEFLQNSLKHSRCKRIVVELAKKIDTLVLKASDDGTGFDFEAKRHQGAGLTNMKKRASFIHADLRIESDSSKGTQMKLTIPYTQLLKNHVTHHRHS